MESAFNITCILVSVSSAISCLEHLRLPSAHLNFLYQSKDLNSKHIPFLKPVLWLAVFLAALLVVFTLCGFWVLQVVSLFTFLFLNGWLYTSKLIGRDGADQLRLISLGVLTISAFIEEDTRLQWATGIISFQVVLSYFTSGFCKVISPQWREADILPRILNTYSYGTPFAAEFLFRHKALSRAAVLVPIGLMLALPFSFLAENNFFLIVNLAGLLCFHIGAAALMGLNDFLFTFPATYPCLLASHFFMHK